MNSINSLMLKIADQFSIETLASEEVSRDWFLNVLHPAGAHCPECDLEIASEKKSKSFWAMRRVTCSGCNKTFSAVTGTALNGLGLDFRALYLLLFLVSCGISPSKFARQLGISTGAAYIWANKAKAAEKNDPQQADIDGVP